MKISPARKAVFEILLKIDREKAFSSYLLPAYEEKLNRADRALCHKLTLGVLRRRMYLDKIIASLTGRGLEQFDAEVLTALRLGTHQLLFFDKIPDYSAINESVNLVKAYRKRSAAGLVNAVLRRVSREEVFEFNFTDPIDKISVMTSHPRWLIENWEEQFGGEIAENIAAANNLEPSLAFRPTVRFARAETARQNEIFELLKSKGVVRSTIAPDSFVAEKADQELLELAAGGLIYFQGESSQLVADAVGLRAGESFLDVCAAPGSKTTDIARKKTDGAQLVAGDLYPDRVAFLKKNCQRQGAGFVSILRYDAEKDLPFARESFDRILVDAPCSGTGTIRNNPEIRYFLRPGDIDELAEKQLRILGRASKLVKRGGRLVYSTCSLEKKENEEIAESFMKLSGFQKIRPGLSEKFLTDQDFVRTFPSRDGTDGFFIAVFEKN